MTMSGVVRGPVLPFLQLSSLPGMSQFAHSGHLARTARLLPDLYLCEAVTQARAEQITTTPHPRL